MKSYSKLNCPEAIYNELEKFIDAKNYIFLTRKLNHSIWTKRYHVNDSFETVEKYIDLYGGKIIYGSSILESDIIFEKQVFAVWEAPDKTYHHITRGSNLSIIFIPNENPYEIPKNFVSDFYNIFPLEKDSCIKDFIANKKRFQELISKGANTLSENEMNEVCRYGDLAALERFTNRKIEKALELKDNILNRIKK